MSQASQEMARYAGPLQSWLREREEEMASLLAELVAIPTENPPGKNYAACADLLEKRLTECGLDCERVLYFHGHYDVVPAQTQEQFRPVRKEHFLFGRGSCDMKGGIVAMLYAIRAMQECRYKPDGRIVLTLVPDEETGGLRGSERLARDGLLGKDGIGMLTSEPTSGVVWNANRGAITIRVRVFGKSAHVGLQHQGENAFERMHRVMTRLLELKHDVE